MSITYTKIEKLTIYSVEGPKIEVTAMMNPKELSVNKSTPWTKSPNSKGNVPDLEFTSAEGRSMSFELLFDTYEEGGNVHTKYVADLVKLSMVRNPDGSEEEKRPPKVGVKWANGALPEFLGVLESVGTKYTMFFPDGTPCRAVVTCQLKEANSLSFKKGS
jgi:hypothetical protein